MSMWDRYRRDFDPSVFEELRDRQLKDIYEGRLLEIAVYHYFRRLNGFPLRKANGAVWDGSQEGKMVWSDVYLRIDEVEEYLATQIATKRSDSTPLKLAAGELCAWELMFLMPKRALGDSKDAGLCDITRYCAVGRMDRQMMTQSLGAAVHQTLFDVYGQTDEDRALRIKPHSLRHLQNTELFRLGIADTIITKRFNRRHVTQSYEYDHRSLSEELDQVELKPEVEARLGEKSATIARLIKSGKARGPIVDAFKRIQLTDGEDAAIDYLAVEADGFHSTPYGHCINSFTVDPCQKHLECFTGCKHLSATDLAQNRHNLVQLETRFGLAVKLLEERKSRSLGAGNTKQIETESASSDGLPGIMQVSEHMIQRRISGSIGLDNQLAHAKVRLEGVRKLLETAPGQLVFPDGMTFPAILPSRKEGFSMASIDQIVKLAADADPEMERILTEMLEADETITARAVARKHPAIGHASSITRIPGRSDLLGQYQERQKQFRDWQGRMPKRSRDQIAAQLAQKDSRIAELERQVEALRVSHLAMIRTVGELGGIGKLLKLYESHREVRSQLDSLHILPRGEVKQFQVTDPVETR